MQHNRIPTTTTTLVPVMLLVPRLSIQDSANLWREIIKFKYIVDKFMFASLVKPVAIPHIRLIRARLLDELARRVGLTHARFLRPTNDIGVSDTEENRAANCDKKR
jgi:hypothetical protein